MNPSKETENKLRWSCDVDGVLFHLYIPKWRVPEPWRERIEVAIEEMPDGPNEVDVRTPISESDADDSIVAKLHIVESHTETVRYRPVGNSAEWELGEPYIPKSLLSVPPPESLRIEVRWDRRSGVWS